MGYWARLRAETKLSQRLIDGLTVNPYHQVMDAGRILVEKNQLEIRKLVNETVVRTVETPLVATPEGFTTKSYNFHLVKAEGQYANDVAAMIALEDRYSVAVLIWEARSGGYKISGRSAALKIFALNKAFQEVEPTAGGHAFSAGMLTKIEPIDVLAKVIERFNGDLFFSRLLEEETKTHETVNV
jgi:single-stranded DNA-specific DHH superfamily exonuclease